MELDNSKDGNARDMTILVSELENEILQLRNVQASNDFRAHKHMVAHASQLINQYCDALERKIRGKDSTLNHVALLEALRPTLSQEDYNRLRNAQFKANQYSRQAAEEEPSHEYIA